MVLPLEELMHAMVDERDREARQIALRATNTSSEGSVRRLPGTGSSLLGRLGGVAMRLIRSAFVAATSSP